MLIFIVCGTGPWSISSLGLMHHPATNQITSSIVRIHKMNKNIRVWIPKTNDTELHQAHQSYRWVSIPDSEQMIVPLIGMTEKESDTR